MSTALIIGASQGIGFETVKQALLRGHRVRAMARSANRIGVDDAKLEKYVGDALNVEDLTAALDGIDVVVQALGIAAGPNMVLRPVHLFSKSTQILLPAMEAAGVKRLITVTGFGAGDSYSRIGCLQRIPFRLVLGRAYDDKDVQERLIRRSNLDWTIARPVILTNGPRIGRYRVLAEPKQWRNGFISRADVADFLVAQIENNDYVGKTPVLAY